MDKTLMLGILLTAKDQFSPVFSTFKSSLSNMTKGTKEFGTAMAGIGTGLKGVQLATQGGAETVIKSFVDLEEAQTQLKNTLMQSDGSVSPFFKSINDEAMKLGNKLPGTTADFLQMAASMKALGVEEKSLIGGGLKSAAYLGAVLKIPYEEAATATAKFKQAMGIADNELLPFIDDIQRLSHMGVQVGEMSFAFSKIGATMKGLGMSGLKAARDVEPLIGMLIKSGFSGETVGTNLGNIIKEAVSFKGNKQLDEMGIKLNFTDDAGNFKGTSNMIKELQKLNMIKSDSARLSVTEAIFGKGEAATMANVLINEGVSGLDKFNRSMKIQADINARAAASGATLGAMWEAMTGTFTNFLAIVGESFAPEMKALTNTFSEIAGGLSSVSEQHPMFAKFIGGIVIGVPVVAGVLGTLGIAVGALTTSLGFLGITSMATFGWIIGGVALVAGAVALFSMDWAGAWEGVKIITINAWNGISSYFSEKWKRIGVFAEALWGTINNIFYSNFETIKNLFSWTPLGIIISNWGVISPYFNGLWSGIKTVFSVGFDVLKTLFNWTPLGLIINNWGAISLYFNGLWSGIKTVFSLGFDVLKTLFNWTPLGLIINNWGAISSAFVAIVDMIKKPFVEFFNWIENKFSSFADKIGSVASFFANNNSSMLTSGAAPIPARVAVTNPRVAAARAMPSRAGTNNTVTVNISNPNFTSKEHAAQTQKQIDEQVRRALAKQANDKKDRSYS